MGPFRTSLVSVRFPRRCLYERQDGGSFVDSFVDSLVSCFGTSPQSLGLEPHHIITVVFGPGKRQQRDYGNEDASGDGNDDDSNDDE